MRHVAGAGNGHALAFDPLAIALEHFLSEVHTAEPGGFRADQAAAVGHALAGQYRGELVAQALVLPKQKTDFTGAHANIAGRHVHVGADMAVQLTHEGLAKAHDFGVALALGIEVRTALAAAHGQGGQGILEGLLEGEEFEYAQVHRRVEAQAALVGADGAVHLDAKPAIDLDLAMIIHPRDPEGNRALRLADALQDARGQVVGVGFKKRPQAA